MGNRTDVNSTVEFMRDVYRIYRNFPVCPGHSILRRVFQSLIGRNQQVRLSNGIRLQVDLQSAIQHTVFWYNGDMEPQLEWAVREFTPVGGTFVDCGANCGYIGLYACRMSSARVVFLEPHPLLAAAIRRNVQLNGWQDRCSVVEAAASNQEGSAPFFESPDYDGENSLLPDWVGGKKQVRTLDVKLTTLATVLRDHRIARVDMLKVDTEGHDVAVLQGLGNRLSPDHVRVIYTELGRDREEGIQRMQNAGYEGYGYVCQRSAKVLRKQARRSRLDQPVALFRSLRESPQNVAELLWVPRGGMEAAHLASLSRLAAAGF